MATLEELLSTLDDEGTTPGTDQPDSPRERAIDQAQTPQEDITTEPVEAIPQPQPTPQRQVTADKDGQINVNDGTTPETALEESAGVSPILRTLLAGQELSSEDKRKSVRELLTKDISARVPENIRLTTGGAALDTLVTAITGKPLVGQKLPKIDGLTFFEGLNPEDVQYTDEKGLVIRNPNDEQWRRFDPSIVSDSSALEFIADSGELLVDIVPDFIGGAAGAAGAVTGPGAVGIAAGVSAASRAAVKSTLGQMIDASEKPSAEWASDITLDLVLNLGSDIVTNGLGKAKNVVAKKVAAKLKSGVDPKQVEKEANRELSKTGLELYNEMMKTENYIGSIKNIAENAPQASKNIVQDTYRNTTQATKFQSEFLDTDLQLNGINALSSRYGLFGSEGGLSTAKKIDALDNIQFNSLKTAMVKQDDLIGKRYVADRQTLLSSPGARSFEWNPSQEINNAINAPITLPSGAAGATNSLAQAGLTQKDGVWKFSEDLVDEGIVSKSILNLPQNKTVVNKFIKNLNEISKVPALKGQAGLSKALDLKRSFDDFIGILQRSQKDPQVKATLESTIGRMRSSIANGIKKLDAKIPGQKSTAELYIDMNKNYEQWADFRGIVREARNAKGKTAEAAKLVKFYDDAAKGGARNSSQVNWYTQMRNSSDLTVRKNTMLSQSADIVKHKINSLSKVGLAKRAKDATVARTKAAGVAMTGAAAKQIRNAAYSTLQFVRQLTPEQKKALMANDAALRSIGIGAARGAAQPSAQEVEQLLKDQGIVK